jgi:membrane-bound lytic murein transglycosylase A
MTLWGCRPERVKPEGFVLLEEKEVNGVLEKLDLSKQGLQSWEELNTPLTRSLAYVSAQPSEVIAFRRYGLEVSWHDLEQTLRSLLSLLPALDTDPDLLQEHFRWYELMPKTLMTGYLEPRIHASLVPRPEYMTPIYGLPDDLKVVDLGRFHPRWQGQRLIYRVANGTIHPYYDREAIERDKILQDKAEIIAWAKDPVDLFFLHIQGSGILELPDGQITRVGYAGNNGRQFISLGRVLDTTNYKEYLQDHPELLPKALYSNPRYVFFRRLKDGPFGAMGKKLTPMVSLAFDPSFIALGSLVVYSVDLPVSKTEGTLPLVGLGLVQDVGGAITGHHLDLFCGTGRQAMYTASHLQDRGPVYLLLKKRQDLL